MAPYPKPSATDLSHREIVLAVALVAALLGAAVPATTRVMTHRARSATKAELGQLTRASREYFHDVGALPTNLRDLIAQPGRRAPGWAGPYLGDDAYDPLTGLQGFLLDAWSRPYETEVRDDVLTICSAAEDAVPGTSDDLTVNLEAEPLRLGETIERLRVVNQAIAMYNSAHEGAVPLPVNWTRAHARLVESGFLPAGDTYLVDGWGDAFVEDPPGSTPVVSVLSVNAGEGLAAAGSGRHAPDPVANVARPRTP